MDDVEAARAAGNDLYRNAEYLAAVQVYSQALDGLEAVANERRTNVGNTLLLNRAACHLQLADAMVGSDNDRLAEYEKARNDVKRALTPSDKLAGAMFPKALFRLGWAELGMQTVRMQQMRGMEGQPPLSARKGISKGLESCCLHLNTALCMQPKDKYIKPKLDEARSLQRELSQLVVQPMSLDEVPPPKPDTLDASVQFIEGPRWIDNRVALDVPVRKDRKQTVRLPVCIAKKQNERGRGELIVALLYSDHSGKGVLRERRDALGIAPRDEEEEDDLWVVLSTESRSDDDVDAADEFVMDQRFFNEDDDLDRCYTRIPAALEQAGVISFVRVAGHNFFGDEFRVYRVAF